MNQLPRGRHQLSPEAVEFDQRRRLLAAVAAALEEHGYAQTTVAQVLEGARVSRKTFYEQFADKDECLLVAYEEAERRAWGLAAEAAAGVPTLVDAGAPVPSGARAPDAASVPADLWQRRVHAALGALLDFIAAEPATARLFTLEARAALPQIATRQRAALDRAAEALRAGNRAHPGPSDLPEDTERRLVDNVAALVGSYVVSGATELLPGLTSQLADHLLQPYAEGRRPPAVR
jgi:AcrR family transcriptional regulator